jgi:hypothetical protein
VQCSAVTALTRGALQTTLAVGTADPTAVCALRVPAGAGRVGPGAGKVLLCSADLVVKVEYTSHTCSPQCRPCLHRSYHLSSQHPRYIHIGVSHCPHRTPAGRGGSWHQRRSHFCTRGRHTRSSYHCWGRCRQHHDRGSLMCCCIHRGSVRRHLRTPGSWVGSWHCLRSLGLCFIRPLEYQLSSSSSVLRPPDAKIADVKSGPR